MQIERRLPQFENEKALIIVSGEQDAILYLAYNGYINEIRRVEIPKVLYTDREGFFGRVGTQNSATIGSSQNKVQASGGVQEPQKQYLETKFIHELTNEIRYIYQKEKIDSLYLFMPDYIDRKFEDFLPRDLLKLKKITIRGNYVWQHPFQMLHKIKDEQDQSAGQKIPRRKEAWELLKRTLGFSKSDKSSKDK